MEVMFMKEENSVAKTNINWLRTIQLRPRLNPYNIRKKSKADLAIYIKIKRKMTIFSVNIAI